MRRARFLSREGSLEVEVLKGRPINLESRAMVTGFSK